MKISKQKISLAILNKLVAALNEQMKVCDDLSKDVPQEDYIVELSKALGVVSAVQVESGALVQDVMSLIKINSVPEVDMSDYLDLDAFGSGRSKSVKN